MATAHSAIPAPARSRLPGLDGMRAVSILLVMAYHLADHCPEGLRGACSGFPSGQWGVWVFFVISGFLITTLLCQEEVKTGRVHLGRFYRRRALRILPPALVYLLAVAWWIGPADFWHSLLFVRNLYPGTEAPLSSHYWSLSIEEQFYFAWPGLFLVLRTRRRRLLFVALAVGAIPAGRHLLHYPVFGELARGHYAILVGCGAALARAPLLPRWLALGCVPVAVLCVTERLPLAMLPFAVSGMVLWAAGHPSWLDAKLLVWVGQLSYSLYLWQEAFCWHAGFSVPLALGLSFACASLSYYLIEQPVLRLRSARDPIPASVKSVLLLLVKHRSRDRA